MTDNGLSLATTEGYQGACSLPTLPGFVIFGALGAAASGRGKRMQGALNALFGAWAACALSRALNVSDDRVASAITIAGAYYTARIFR